MRILWLSHNIPYPPVGGVLQRNFHLVREMAGRTELHLVALRQRALCPDAAAVAEAQRELERYCASVRLLPLPWDESRAVRATRLMLSPLRSAPYLAARYESPACHAALAVLRRTEFDVVHFDTVGLLNYRRDVPGPPAVLNHHNVESAMLERRGAGETQPLARLFFRRQAARVRAWERRFAPRMHLNLVVSVLDGERLHDIAPGAHVAVVPNGVDTAYFDRPANGDADARAMVLVGGHTWYPNRDAVEYFLDDIWPRIVAEESRAECVIIGRHPCRRAVAAAAADGRVRVLGFVDDLRDAVQRAAVFACPFRQGGGTRLKVLDALAMRKALVSTSVGAEGIPLEDGRQFLRADTAEGFAAHCVDLIRRPERRVELGEAGRRFVETQYDWASIGREQYALYESLAHAPAADVGNGRRLAPQPVPD